MYVDHLPVIAIASFGSDAVDGLPVRWSKRGCGRGFYPPPPYPPRKPRVPAPFPPLDSVSPCPIALLRSLLPLLINSWIV
jgi:hypothetical protein